MQQIAKFREAALLVDGTEDYSGNLGPICRACTHYARFDCHVKGAALQVLTPNIVRRSGERLHFGMSRYIIEPFGKIMAFADNASIVGNNRSYRNLALFECGLGLL